MFFLFLLDISNSQKSFMSSKLKIGSHTMQPLVMVFPALFYTTSFGGFIVYHIFLDPFWFKLAITANSTGIIVAMIAALLVLIDRLNGVKSPALKWNPMLCNLGALVLFCINLYMQCPKWGDSKPDEAPAILISGFGFFLTVIGGFIGWNFFQKNNDDDDLEEEHERIDPLDGIL
jgi:uncharacterized membrane protein